VSEEKQGIFRKQALERMSSPERLDQLIQIVSPRDWLLLGTMLAVMVFVVAWCMWGRLPTTLTGQGVIVRPRKIVEIQSSATGKLVSFNLRVGDEVRKGETLGLIDQTEIRKQLQEDRARLAELEVQDREKNALQQEQTRLQARDAAAQKNYLRMQIANREQSIKNDEALAPVLEKRRDVLREAVYQGLEPKISAELLVAEKEYLENQAQISSLHTELSEIESQIKQLDTKETELARTLFEASSSRKNQMLELRKNIALYEVQLAKNTQIVSEHSGRLVEIAANLGQVMNPGARLASLEVQEATADLVGVTYFPVRDGKRIRTGMSIQVTPDTVKRERFGGIRGRVLSVSAFPVTKEGAALLLGNSEIAQRLLKDEPQIEVVAELEKDSSTYSGYKWSSSKGPRLPITAATTTSGRVTVEMRSPVTYILPFLRAMSGIY
jgi:HlyD family secretion protein